LDHKNILKVFEKFDTPEKIFFVLELCRGKSLRDDVAEHGPYKEHQAVVVISQILDALQYMHSKGIAHRDLKPDNILYADKSRKLIKLIDFGYSKDVNNEKNQQTMVGTPDYVAPEVMQGTIEDVYKVDLWSVGCVTYFLLLGESAFEKFLDDVRSLCGAIMDGNYSIDPAKVSEEGESFIRKLMCSYSADRLSAAEALQEEWILKNNQVTDTTHIVAYLNPDMK